MMHTDELMQYHSQFWDPQSYAFDIGPADIGDVHSDDFIEQTTAFTCAVVSQEMILHDFGIISPDTGNALSEAELTYIAATHGWLDNGTSQEDMGNLLEYYGVVCHQGIGLENMVHELAQGHKVIVAVDADELWNKDSQFYNDFIDSIGGEQANHAIVVKGIKFDDNGDPLVVVNDPGDPHGAGREYSIDQFTDAFEDSGFYYVATDHPPPELENHAIFGQNFDALQGEYSGLDHWIESIPPDTTSPGGIFFLKKGIDQLNESERLSIMKNL